MLCKKLFLFQTQQFSFLSNMLSVLFLIYVLISVVNSHDCDDGGRCSAPGFFFFFVLFCCKKNFILFWIFKLFIYLKVIILSSYFSPTIHLFSKKKTILIYFQTSNQIVFVWMNFCLFFDVKNFELLDFSLVTCGSVIKLRHIASSYRLHSHEVSYGNR